MGLVRGYQVALSPWLGGRCRFEPTCSHYAMEAFRIHGARRGSWLALRRLARCHPWGGAGPDPVPSTRRVCPACAKPNAGRPCIPSASSARGDGPRSPRRDASAGLPGSGGTPRATGA
ncbi:MAG: membrane protein insertion efficiency factor YidD [Planctomycetes bacterium]|nr:membrane protein insertion efficiency factor YidD [Planctomycetota bacterium]